MNSLWRLRSAQTIASAARGTAKALFHLDRYDESLADLNRALEVDPTE